MALRLREPYWGVEYNVLQQGDAMSVKPVILVI
jgi:hypothetical protein